MNYLITALLKELRDALATDQMLPKESLMRLGHDFGTITEAENLGLISIRGDIYETVSLTASGLRRLETSV